MRKLFVFITLLFPYMAWGQIYLQTDEREISATRKLIKELKDSANNGDANASFKLGNLFFNGEVIKEDYKEALKWYETAVNNGYNPARELMGDVQMKMLEDGVQKQNIKYGDALSLAVAIVNCYHGAIICTDDTNDKKRIAAKINRIGDFWYYDEDVESYFDLDEESPAIRCYKLAAKYGDVDASSFLGLYYENKKDYQNALNYFIISADGGDFISQARAGVYLYDGKNVNRDSIKAYKYLRLACLNPDEDDVVDFIEAQNGQSGGLMHRLASCYRYGLGTSVNVECANYWDILSALYGDINGEEILTYNGLNIRKDDPNIWQSVMLKFQPVMEKASDKNISAEVLYYLMLTNSKDEYKSSFAFNFLRTFVETAKLDDAPKAFIYDFFYGYYNLASKTENNGHLSSEANKYLQRRKNMNVDEEMLGKWLLNTLRLSMIYF